jgi:SAM-dependent methyltransferase
MTITQVEPQPIPAIADPDNAAAVQRLIERLEANITPAGPVLDPDWYGWIPLPLANFLEGMLLARRILGPGRHRFLDIGSGIGTKLILAHELGFHAFGIERWHPYLHVSQRIAPFATVVHADAARYEPYHTFDLIYLYGVATDPADHEQINRHITSRMRAGALFFCARRPFPAWLEHAGGLIWRT